MVFFCGFKKEELWFIILIYSVFVWNVGLNFYNFLWVGNIVFMKIVSRNCKDNFYLSLRL